MNKPKTENTIDGSKVQIRELEKVTIKEGDLVVLRFPSALRGDSIKLVQEQVENHILEPLGLRGKCKVIILDCGAELCVLERQVPGMKYKGKVDE